MDGDTEMFNSFVIKILGWFCVFVKREMSTFVGLKGGKSLEVRSHFFFFSEPYFS